MSGEIHGLTVIKKMIADAAVFTMAFFLLQIVH
jgi:hypothetical protein